MNAFNDGDASTVSRGQSSREDSPQAASKNTPNINTVRTVLETGAVAVARRLNCVIK